MGAAYYLRLSSAMYKRPPASLMARAVSYLSRREYSRAELARKLSQTPSSEHKSRASIIESDPSSERSFETQAENLLPPLTAQSLEEEIKRVLDVLEEQGLLSTERFAQSLAHRKASRFGVARIMQQLQPHDVQAEVMAEIKSQLKDSEHARAKAIWQKKFGSIPKGQLEMAKQVRFLTSRGFSTSLAIKVVHGAGMEE